MNTWVRVNIHERGIIHKYVAVSVDIKSEYCNYTQYIYTMRHLIRFLKDLEYDMLNILQVVFLIRKTEAMFWLKKWRF